MIFTREFSTTASAEMAFAFVSDPRNAPSYDRPLRAVKIAAGPVKPGDRFVSVVPGAPGGEIQMEIVRIDPPRYFEMRGRTGGVTVRDMVTIAKEPGGSRVRLQVELRARGWALLALGVAPLLGGLLVRDVARQLRRELEARAPQVARP